MNKEKKLNLAVTALPVLALIISLLPESVMFYDSVSGRTTYTSFYGAFSQAAAPWWKLLCVVIAANLNVFLTAFVLFSFVKNSKRMRGPVRGCSFVTAVIAALPILLREGVTVVPNALFLLLMLVEWVLSGALAEEKESERLSGARSSGKKKSGKKK